MTYERPIGGFGQVRPSSHFVPFTGKPVNGMAPQPRYVPPDDTPPENRVDTCVRDVSAWVPNGTDIPALVEACDRHCAPYTPLWLQVRQERGGRGPVWLVSSFTPKRWPLLRLRERLGKLLGVRLWGRYERRAGFTSVLVRGLFQRFDGLPMSKADKKLCAAALEGAFRFREYEIR